MTTRRIKFQSAVLTTVFVVATFGHAAVDPATKCEASRAKAAGKYALCRFKADAKSLLKNAQPDYEKCDRKISESWTKSETKYGAECPETNDVENVKAFLSDCADDAVVPTTTTTTTSAPITTSSTTTTTACVPFCRNDGAPCGPDGCGKSCGSCASGEVCLDGICGLPACPVCGDSICEGDEDLCNCIADCPGGPCKCVGICGDGACDPCENNESCPQDCALSCEQGPIVCPVCGDGTCNGDETGCNCSIDCPPRTDCTKCIATCGDGNCWDCESHESCPVDCALKCGTCPCP